MKLSPRWSVSAMVAACAAMSVAMSGAAIAAADAHDATRGSAAAIVPERTVVGVLRSVMTFAESTGWNIANASRGFEVDVSAVLARAEQLNGKRVRAVGHFEQRRYDYATVRVFVVTGLRRA